MQRYGYRNHVKADVKEWLDENREYVPEFGTAEEMEQWLIDTLWTEDAVTGNASGSYTFSRWDAEECLMHNEVLMQETIYEFGMGGYIDPETMDVSIRCYLLPEAVAAVVEEEWA